MLTSGTLHDWARRLWNFDKPYRHGGRELGTGTQIGISLGVALAHRGKGRLVVDLQPDGDLMFDAGSLWIAAKYQIPMLIVMYNNRAYYNDWNHQIVMARNRGTDRTRHIGMELADRTPTCHHSPLHGLVREDHQNADIRPALTAQSSSKGQAGWDTSPSGAEGGLTSPEDGVLRIRSATHARQETVVETSSFSEPSTGSGQGVASGAERSPRTESGAVEYYDIRAPRRLIVRITLGLDAAPPRTWSATGRSVL